MATRWRRWRRPRPLRLSRGRFARASALWPRNSAKGAEKGVVETQRREIRLSPNPCCGKAKIAESPCCCGLPGGWRGGESARPASRGGNATPDMPGVLDFV